MDERPNAETREKGAGQGGESVAAQTVNVAVIPKIRQGNNVYCEITRGQGTGDSRVKGGVIKLPAGASYTVNFELQAGDIPNLAWSPDNAGSCTAFWSDANGCPIGGQDAQVTQAPTSNGNTITLVITPDQTKGPNVVHYALNFVEGGTTPGQFDPIIVVGK